MFLTYEDWHGHDGYESFRNSLIMKHENTPLYVKGDSATAADLDAYVDTASIAIGYGFDLLARNSSEINEYLTRAGHAELSATDKSNLDSARAAFNRWRNVPESQRESNAELTTYLGNLAGSLGVSVADSNSTTYRRILTHYRDNLDLQLGSENQAEQLVGYHCEKTIEKYLDKIPDSKEKAAIASVLYQLPGSPTIKELVGNPGTESLRIKLWLEIRYNSGSSSYWERRKSESDIFGLFSTPSGAYQGNESEALEVLNFMFRGKMPNYDVYEFWNKPGFNGALKADFEAKIGSLKGMLEAKYTEGVEVDAVYSDVVSSGVINADDYKSSGNDLIFSRSADGGKGDDYLYARGNGGATLKGGVGDDYIEGGSSADYLYGGDDDDHIEGREGGDYIEGGAGEDDIYGGSGSDVIFGLDDADYLYGEEGDDQLEGGEGNDQIFGGDDIDNLYGGAGNDTLEGGDQQDQLYGGADNDVLDGGGGVDVLYGGSGADTLKGGDDFADDVLFGEAGADKLEGGKGRDIYNVDLADVVFDEDGRGNVYLSNKLLTGGTRKEEDPENEYKGGGNTYVLTGTTLVINGGLTINQFKKGDLGIFLETEPEEPEELPDITKPEGNASPIILDLDRDGIETSALAATYFDHGGDGLSERSGWVSPDDGLLVRDLNGDGLINKGAELFGNNSVLKNGQKASNGFQALAEYDDNRDGKVDALDASFASLQVWRDLNSNGISEQGELQGLAEAGVLSINTSYTNSTYADANGHAHRQQGSFTLADGATSTATDVWFKIDAGRRINSGSIELTADVVLMPNAKGFGKLHDLHQAMVLDAGLKDLVTQYIAATDATAKSNLLDGLIYRWAGAANVDPASRKTMWSGYGYGGGLDARRLITMEQLVGRGYQSRTGWGANPGPNASREVNAEYLEFKRFTAAQILAQTEYASELESIRSHFGSDASSIVVSWDMLGDKLAQLYEDGEDERLSGVISVLDDLGMYSPRYRAEQGAGFLAIGRTHVELAGFFSQSIQIGTAQDDYLSGVAEGTNFAGRGGDDRLFGQAGGDAYYFSKEDGADTILDRGGVDQLVFGAGITQADLEFTRDTTTVWIKVKNADSSSAGSVRIDNFYDANNHVAFGAIETIRFADNSRLNLADMFLQGTITAGDDLIFGTAQSDNIAVLTGNDRLYGLKGDDQLSGNEGNDSLYGGEGNDQLSGDEGNDTLFGESGSDTLAGGTGDDALNGGQGDDQLSGDEGNDTLLGDEGNDQLTGNDGDDQLYGGQGNDQLSGGEGNDTLFGESGNDTLAGGAGDDVLLGGGGDNIYRFGLGDGHDRIQTQQWVTLGNDVLQLEAGLVPADVYLTRQGNDLQVVLTATGDSVTVENYFTSANVGIRSIAFTDGTSWDRAAIDRLSLIGNDDDNLLQGYASADLVLGNGGNDKLYGFSGNDTLDGGAGDDLLDGSIGNDVYRFGRGAGHDVIEDRQGTADRIKLAADVLPDDVLVRRVGADLLLTIRDSGDTLFVRGGLPGDNSALAIETVQFANGTVWDGASLRQLALAGTAGADRLEGSNAADLIDGLAGNDLLMGMGGNDTYTFGVGDGQDSIEDHSGTDIVQFKAGVDAAGVDYAVDGNDLLVTLQGSGDSLRLKNWQSSSVQNLRFFDGTLVSRANIQALLGLGSDYEAIYGTADADIITGSKAGSSVYGGAGDDVISGGAGGDYLLGEAGNDSLDGGVDDDYLYGGAGDDILDGGVGRDYLVGEAGNNRYLLNYGSGLDQIQASVGGTADDTVVFGSGVTLDQVSVQFGDQSYVSGAGTLGYRQMVVGIGGDDAFSIQGSEWNSDIGLGSVRYFEFADGTVLTLEEMAARADNGVVGYQSDYNGINSLVGSNADDSIYARTGDDIVQARGNNDYVSGGSGDDILSGGSGSDTLEGGDGDDLLAGEVDDDRLYGGQGDDVFVFNLGDGHDTIEDYSPNGAAVDTLSFGNGINLANLSTYVEGGNLHILVAGGAENSITLSGFTASLEPDAVSGLPTRLQIVGTDGSVQIFDLHAWASAHTGALLASSALLPIDLAGSLSSYDLTGTVAPAGGYRAIAYGQTGSLFGVANFSSSNLASEVNDVLMGTLGQDSLAGLGGNDVIVGDAEDDLLDGGAGNDVVVGGSGNDTLIGSSGSDKLYGGTGSDFLDPGTGSDYAAGGRGGDVYSYFAGNGYLTIEDNHLEQNDGGFGGEEEVEDEGGDYGSTVDLDPNILQFGPGIRYEDLRFSEENGDLIITTGNAGDRLRLVGYDPTRATFSRSIDQFRFVDGVVVEAQPGGEARILLGSDGDDGLRGDEDNNDEIRGGAGNDVIEAGSGNDHLIGGDGSDSYLFSEWDTGIKVINDINLPGAENHIVFGDGISADDIDFVGYGELGLEVRFENGLVLRFPGFDRYQEDMPPPVADFIFSDGSSLSFADVLVFGTSGTPIDPVEIIGTPDSDLLYGTDGADHIRGLGSDDILVGGAGDDVYFIGENDGNDTIIDVATPGAGNTVVLLDVDPDSLTLSYDPDSGELIINSPNSDNILRLSGFDPNDPLGSHAVEFFDFGSVVLSYEELLSRGFEILGTDDSDYLGGTALSDYISGGDGQDVLFGSTGNDELDGGAEDDVYMFTLGDGLDVINDTEGGNIIVFSEDISLQDISCTVDGDALILSYGNLGDTIRILNYAQNGEQDPLAVSQIVFLDGSSYSFAELLNSAPVLATPLVDASSNEDAVFSYTVPATAFTDVDLGDALSYSAKLVNGAALPSWLSFDAATRTFSGTPLNGDVGVIDIAITATDLAGAKASDVFRITVNNSNDAPLVSAPLADVSSSEDALFRYTLPAATFTDVDLGDALSYSAKLVNGAALPSWLSFDAATRTFSGTPLNGDVGVIDIAITATDLAGASASDVFRVTINNINDAPVISLPLADASSNEGALFSYTLPASTFTDVDLGDALSYSATLANGAALPAWLSFDAATRTLSGTPLNGDVGVIDIAITATDLAGATAADVFRVTVNNTNDAPVVSAPLADASSNEDALFRYTVPVSTFTDVDLGDALSYSATLANGAALPAWLSFDAATRTLSGTPLNGNVGVIDIAITATDLAGATAADVFRVTINNTNDAPVVSLPLADASSNEDAAFSYTVPATAFTDVDQGDALSYSATLANGDALPSWLSFDAATRTFSGTPLNGDVGVVEIVVTATDLAGATASDVFSVTVNNTNDAPVVSQPLADASSNEDALFRYTVPASTFTDADLGDALSYSAKLANGDALPSWLSFDAATRTLSGTPLNGNVGVIDIAITATDLAGATASDVFRITVNNTNDAPTLSNAIADQSGSEGTSFNYALPANTFVDVDANDSLTLSASLSGGAALPTWLVFDASTRTFSGTPPAGSAATLNIQVKATDAAGAQVADVFAFVVAASASGSVIYGTWCSDRLVGTSGNDTIYGLFGDDLLNGGVGADTMIGGWGDDTYIVDNVNDVVTEDSCWDYDTVQARVSYRLGAHVERLVLTGTAAINGTGNGLDNTLIGNNAANTLDGAQGADLIVGGGGNDTYFVDNACDVVVEQACDGTDTVNSSVSYALGLHVENLALIGTAAINGTGNTRDNVLTGNNAANKLSGGAGNDTLDGRGGADTLTGGLGNDTYLFGRGYGADTVVEYDATKGNVDVAKFQSGVSVDQLWFKKVLGTNNLEVSVVGTTDKLTIKDWYASNASHVEQFKTSDGKTLLDSNVQNLVNAMASFAPPAPGQTSLSSNYHAALDTVIAASWK